MGNYGELRTISVLIATFNHSKFIGEALQSIFEAEKALNIELGNYNIEIIVVDDGSTDNTRKIIENYERNRSEKIKIKYLYQNNQGQSAAYENALDLITGEWIYLLDSDDRFLPDKFIKTIEIFDSHQEVGLIVHPLIVIDSKGERTGELRPKAAKLSHGNISDIMKKYGRHVAAATSGLAFRTKLFKDIHPNPLYGMRSAADAYLSFAASYSQPVYALSEPLAEYRQHSGSQYFKRMTTIEGLERSIRLQEKILEKFDLLNTLEKNSYFARNILALKKVKRQNWLNSLYKLNKAIVNDPFLPLTRKIIFIGFWNSVTLLPKSAFWYFWIYFQKVQTGFRK